MPDDLIRSMTAVIASVLRRCASAAVRARFSAPMVTQARSGGRFTIASPVVTITGGEGGAVCASAGVAKRRRANVEAFMISTFLRSRRTRNTKPDGVRIRVGRHLVAMAARQHPHVG